MADVEEGAMSQGPLQQLEQRMRTLSQQLADYTNLHDDMGLGIQLDQWSDTAERCADQLAALLAERAPTCARCGAVLHPMAHICFPTLVSPERAEAPGRMAERECQHFECPGPRCERN